MTILKFQLPTLTYVKWIRYFLLLICFQYAVNVFAQSKTVDSLSFISLKLEVYNNSSNISTATGFLVKKHDKVYLITNLHVFTGKDYYSQATIDSFHRLPNIIAIWHNTNILGNWQRTGETLYDRSGNKRWIEYANENGILYDLAALPLENIPQNVKTYFLNLNSYVNDMNIVPGTAASIIGFPYGMASFGRFAIWKTGHLASDIDLDADNLPVLMIDATTKPGMSGSIVVVRQFNYVSKTGTTYMGKTGTSFIGIYSAQSNQEEIGYVWKPSALQKLLETLP